MDLWCGRFARAIGDGGFPRLRMLSARSENQSTAACSSNSAGRIFANASTLTIIARKFLNQTLIVGLEKQSVELARFFHRFATEPAVDGWRCLSTVFSFKTSNAKLSVDAGSVELPDDMTARSFGQRIIEEFNSGESGAYFGWTLDIKHGDRLVAIIPFKSRTNRNKAA